MIGEVVRGNSMPDLISYLFGPGKHNEHVNQHLVAGFADAVFTADDRLWKDEPGIQRRVHAEARSLGWQVEFPHSRWGTEIGDGYVWHCSVSISQDEGGLTDAQWSEAAHEIVRALGFDGADGKAPCRWVAVRHGLSGNGNDHIHIAVNLVREDGTRASTWNDYRKVGRACSALEDRFGLRNVPGRITGRHLPEPSRADTEISARNCDPEPLRIGLERKVRACAAIATSEEHFTRLAAERGLLVRPRLGADGTSIGYAFADATARRTKTGTPLWFGGGKLASDLTARKIQQRWRTPADPVTRAADAAAIAAVVAEPGSPGSLAHAERHMARAAQAGTILAGMAATFLAVTRAGTASPQSSALILAEEADALIRTCIAVATTAAARRDITTASTLVHTTVVDLANRAETEARHALNQGDTMTDLTHEDEFLTHLTQAGVLSARLTQALLAGGKGTGGVTAKQIAALKAAGYTETTPYDQDLRRLLGEPRWASYLADPARIVAAAAITDAAAAGCDMPKLLERAVSRRRWEDDELSPSRSVAKILAYRVTSEMRRQATTRRSTADRPHDANQDHITTNGSVPQPPVPAQREKPPAPTPYDGTLRDLLGERRWQQYADDGRRAAVADLLTQAGAEGRDMKALITHVVEFRKFEDDKTSPSRRVAGVLHYRLKAALASGKFPPRDPDALADRSKAPATSTQPSPPRTDQVPPHRTAQRTDQREGR